MGTIKIIKLLNTQSSCKFIHKMKLLPIFATSALLTGYQAYEQYAIDNYDKCGAPIKVGGKKCFEVKSKFAFKKSKNCSSEKANALELTSEGKLCADDLCLTIK